MFKIFIIFLYILTINTKHNYNMTGLCTARAHCKLQMLISHGTKERMARGRRGEEEPVTWSKIIIIIITIIIIIIITITRMTRKARARARARLVVARVEEVDTATGSGALGTSCSGFWPGDTRG